MDLVQYSLQDAIAFNSGTLSFVVDCPVGFSCPPGSFPITINFPPGTFTVILPPTTGGNDNNQPIVLSLQGCQSLITITLPAGSSQAAINAAAQSIIMQVAAQQAQCNVTPIPPGTPPTTGPQPPIPPSPPGTIPIPIPTPQPQPDFFNEAVYFSKPCTNPAVITYTATLPSWVTVDTANSRLVGSPGTFGGTTQINANATAQSVLNAFANAAITAGTLICFDPTAFSWNNLVWNDPPNTQIDGGTGTWIGDHWTATANNTLGPTNPATADNTSSMTISTIDVIHCRLTVVITTWNVVNPGLTNCPINITQDTNPILSENLSAEAAPGTYIFDFDINPAIASLIEVTNAAAQNFELATQIVYTATLSVLP